MHKKQKTILAGVLTAILIPMLTIAIGAQSIEEASAQNVGTYSGHDKVTKKYGSATEEIVCGDKLCSELDKSTDKVETWHIKALPRHFPTIEIVEAFQFSPGHAPHAYIVVQKVTGGNENLKSLNIVLESDIDSAETSIIGLFAGEDTVLINRIHAIDPTTIVARTTSYQLEQYD